MLNLAIQIFSFDSSLAVLNLLGFLEPLFHDFSAAKIIFTNHAGTRKSRSLKCLLTETNSPLHFNEAYIPAEKQNLSSDFAITGLKQAIIHISLSPSAAPWETCAPVVHKGKSSRQLRYAQSLERTAAVRKVDPFPTVLEISFETLQTNQQSLLAESSALIARCWGFIPGITKAAVIDVGGNWLFFPKSGYNPHVSELRLYNCPDLQSNWAVERQLHNVSISDLPGGSPELIVHRETIHASAW